MRNGPFDASQFVPTQFSSAADKAAFGNQLLHFAKADFSRTLFKKAFYNRLCQTFGHIAHYDLSGFYSTWFEDDATKLAFVRHTLRHPCYGDPAFTFSDVERAIQIEVDRLNLATVYCLRVEQMERAKDLSELERLQRKYAPPIAPALPPDPLPELRAGWSERAVPTSEPGFERVPVQGSLF